MSASSDSGSSHSLDSTPESSFENLDDPAVLAAAPGGFAADPSGRAKVAAHNAELLERQGRRRLHSAGSAGSAAGSVGSSNSSGLTATPEPSGSEGSTPAGSQADLDSDPSVLAEQRSRPRVRSSNAILVGSNSKDKVIALATTPEGSAENLDEDASVAAASEQARKRRGSLDTATDLTQRGRQRSTDKDAPSGRSPKLQPLTGSLAKPPSADSSSDARGVSSNALGPDGARRARREPTRRLSRSGHNLNRSGGRTVAVPFCAPINRGASWDAEAEGKGGARTKSSINLDDQEEEEEEEEPALSAGDEARSRLKSGGGGGGGGGGGSARPRLGAMTSSSYDGEEQLEQENEKKNTARALSGSLDLSSLSLLFAEGAVIEPSVVTNRQVPKSPSKAGVALAADQVLPIELLSPHGIDPGGGGAKDDSPGSENRYAAYTRIPVDSSSFFMLLILT